jgi:uncharacterized membrane protein
MRRSLADIDVRNWVGALLSVAFPALVYVGRDRVSAQWLALVLVVIIWLRRRNPFGLRHGPWLVAGGLLLAGMALGRNDVLPLKLYPVLVNGGLLTIFAWSLWCPPPVAERIARLGYPDLPKELVTYTRKVTQAWCVFFAANAVAALWTAVWGSDDVWFYYNGVIAYLLAGLMFGGEWFLRRRLLKTLGWEPTSRRVERSEI